MKRSLAAMLLLVALVAQGCWSRIEVNDIAIVGTLGFDVTEDGRYETWLAVSDVQGRSGGQGGGNEAPVTSLVYRATGASPTAALRSVQKMVSRRLFWTHVRVIWIGEALARQGVRPVLDFLTRHPGVRLTSHMLLVEGGLENAFPETVGLERSTTEFLRELEAQQGVAVSLGDYVSDLAEKGVEPFMGNSRVTTPSPQSRAKVYQARGAGVFKGDRLVALLPGDETGALLWILNRWQRTTREVLVRQTEMGPVTLKWARARTRLRASQEGGRIVLRIQMNIRGSLIEVSPEVDVSDEQNLMKVERAVAATIEDQVVTLVERMQSLEVDVLGFGRQVAKDLPYVWPQLKMNWDEEFPRVKPVVSVRVQIDRTGSSSRSRAASDEEG